MDLMYALLGIGLAFFAFLLSLILVAELLGGEWVLIAQGLTAFMPWVVVFALAFFVLVALMGRR